MTEQERDRAEIERDLIASAERLLPLVQARSPDEIAELLYQGRRQDHRAREAAAVEARKHRIDTLLSIVRQSLPNALGTIFGGAVLGLVAIVGGAIDDVPWSVTATLVLIVVSVSITEAVASRRDPAPFDEEAERAEAKRSADRILSLYVREDPPPDDE